MRRKQKNKNKKKKTKPTNLRSLNSVLLNNQWVYKSRRKYNLETNENGNTIIQNSMWHNKNYTKQEIYFMQAHLKNQENFKETIELSTKGTGKGRTNKA